MLLIGQPTSSAWVGDMIGEVGFWKTARLKWGVGWVVVYHVAPIAERLEKGPAMWGQWGLCEGGENPGSVGPTS